MCTVDVRVSVRLGLRCRLRLRYRLVLRLRHRLKLRMPCMQYAMACHGGTMLSGYAEETQRGCKASP